MNGLNTLRIKESDRIRAVKTELQKFGVECDEPGRGILELKKFSSRISGPVTVSTYEDHRMAMAFAAMAILHPGVAIENPDVVKKSYPKFWEEVKKLGGEMNFE